MRAVDLLHHPLWLPGAGLLLGGLFGALLRATGFCAMGGVTDAVLIGDWRRLRAWLFATAVAIAGAQAAVGLGVFDPERLATASNVLSLSGPLAGGLLFGIGMVFAGGCASRNLARAGGGDGRALAVVVLLGAVGWLVSVGPFESVRTAIVTAWQIELPWASDRLGDVVSQLAGISQVASRMWSAVALAGVLGAWCLSASDFRRSPRHLLSGIGVGLLVAAGFVVTSAGFDEMALSPRPVTSLTFVRPVADTLVWLGVGTAGWPSFGIAVVFGTWLGALVVALGARTFRFEGFAGRGDALRSMTGAALMGIGGTSALGCTIGQGVTGMAMLAMGSILTLVSLVVGGVIGLILLERWVDLDA